jgi:hypothetical protein
MPGRSEAGALCIEPRRLLRPSQPLERRAVIGATRISRQRQRIARIERPKRHRGSIPKLILAGTVELTNSARRASSVLQMSRDGLSARRGLFCVTALAHDLKGVSERGGTEHCLAIRPSASLSPKSDERTMSFVHDGQGDDDFRSHG